MAEGEPPSDAARILLFLDLVEGYRELAEVLPAERKMRIGGAERDPRDHWNRLLRAFALRKFVAKRDQVWLVKVASSLQLLAPDFVDAGFADGIAERIASSVEKGWSAFGAPDGSHERGSQIVFDTLYGQYLHADYDRWQRSKDRPDLFQEMALWSWIGAVEDLIYQLEGATRSLREVGRLPQLDQD